MSKDTWCRVGTCKAFRKHPIGLLDILFIKGLLPESYDSVWFKRANIRVILKKLHGTLGKGLPGGIMAMHTLHFYVIFNFVTFQNQL